MNLFSITKLHSTLYVLRVFSEWLERPSQQYLRIVIPLSPGRNHLWPNCLVWVYFDSLICLSGRSMKKILVVEDDRAVQKSLVRLFQSEDYDVEIRTDGKSGL